MSHDNVASLQELVSLLLKEAEGVALATDDFPKAKAGAGEKFVGNASKDAQSIYALYRKYKRDSIELGKRANDSNNTSQQKRDFRDRSEVLSDKSDSLKEFFWTLVKVQTKTWGRSLGLRKNWKIYTLPKGGMYGPPIGLEVISVDLSVLKRFIFDGR